MHGKSLLGSGSGAGSSVREADGSILGRFYNKAEKHYVVSMILKLTSVGTCETDSHKQQRS